MTTPKLLRTVLLACALACPVAAVAEPPATRPNVATERLPSMDEVGRFVMTYHRDPQPARVPTMLRAIDAAGAFADEDASGSMLGAVAGLAVSDDALPAAMAEVAADLTPAGRLAVTQGLALAGTDASGAAAATLAGRFPDEPLPGALPFSLATMPLRLPGHLDVMWGAYFTTGDAAYARRVTEVLAELPPTEDEQRAAVAAQGADLMPVLTAMSAKWSLGSIAKSEPPVREMLAAVAADEATDARTRQHVEEILADLAAAAPPAG